MKVTLRFCSLVFLIFSYTNMLLAQWIQSSGPFGRDVLSFSKSRNRLFAVCNDSIFVSTDNGSHWSGINNGLNPNGYWLRSFAASGPNLFAITGGGAVFHSTNGGDSWTGYGANLSGSPIWDFAAYDTNIFAGTYGSGVFRSTDGGVTWTGVDSGLNDLNIASLIASKTNLFLWNSSGIFLSTNNGTSWSSVAAADKGFNLITANDTVLYAGVTIGVSGIYRSNDRGNTWIPLENTPSTGLTALAVNGSRIFAGTYNGLVSGVFLSSDNGSSWTPINNGLTNRQISTLAFDDSILFAGTETGGVYVSTDYGTSWAEANNGMTGTRVLAVTSLAVSGRSLFAGTWGGGVFLSTDKGTSWNEINEGLGIKHVLSLAVKGTKLFAGTSVGGIFLFENEGASWIPVNNGLPNVETARMSFPLVVCDSNLFAGLSATLAGVYRTTNSGASWIAVNDGLPSLAIWSVASFAVSETTIYVGGYGVFLSTDNGANWIADTAGLLFPGAWITSLAVSDTDLFAGIGNYGVFHSTRNGTGWTAVNSGLPTMGTRVTCMATIGRNLFAGVNGSGVYLSTNNGRSWTEVSPDWTFQSIYSLVADDSTIFVGLMGGVWQGMWHRQLSEMITKVADGSNEIPSHFKLRQNYPNPFNPSTIISFDLPSRSFVSLKVFDILGREVATLVSEQLAAGTYTQQWNAASFPSGVYFYRLQADHLSETKKLILLR